MWGSIENRPVTSFWCKQAVKEAVVCWDYVFNASVALSELMEERGLSQIPTHNSTFVPCYCPEQYLVF